MRRKLIAGNWKMNGTREGARSLLVEVCAAVAQRDGVDWLVCPPFVLLGEAAAVSAGTPVALGAQNVSEHAAGAYTGEVSAGMLAEALCRFVIVGHSERRRLYGESSKVVAAKFSAARRAGLTPVLCVGETLEQRRRGETTTVIREQLEAVLDQEGVQSFADAVVAYEPVWAVGTGTSASPEQVQEVHALIRARVAEGSGAIASALRILYGGSVTGSNAHGLFSMPDVDGGLIGGASLKANEFLAIGQAAMELAS